MMNFYRITFICDPMLSMFEVNLLFVIKCLYTLDIYTNHYLFLLLKINTISHNEYDMNLGTC